ncbi:MAG: Ig-like domain-containing protein [Gemmatimonas sp.]
MACRKDSPTGPNATPAAIRLQAGNGQTAAVGATLAIPLSVVVTDASGKVVSGARVDWDVGVGAGTTAPTSSTSNSDGVASTIWTLGTVAGTLRVSAQVGGLTPVVFTATALPGAAAFVITTPDRAYLGLGDTIRIRATARDQYGNDVSAQAVNFSAPDPAVATVNSTGLVTAVGLGNARIVADAGGKADTVAVTVGPAGSSVCGPITASTLALGEVLVPAGDAAGVRACVVAPVGVNAEYALTLISTSALFSTVTSVDVFATGNTGPTTAALVVDAGNLQALSGAPTFGADVLVARQPATDVPRMAELERRALERRELTPLVESARAWHRERDGVAALSSIADLAVGDPITLNANANKACTDPINRVSRVAAVGEKSIVVADNGNPSGGYTDAEYASIAATFDTLVFPLDTTAFGAPSNVSGRGKIILFFTRSVNSLTPPSTTSYTIGGFFFARDLYPKTARNGLAACASSNETEMFYLLVPDPDGTVNNNKRSKAEVTTLNLGTITHEFEHLINSGRRLYVNTNAVPNEETWLDEGLAHTAEELLYYRISGFSSRQNLTLSQVSQQATLFSNYASQNFSRFYTYLINPELNSPYAPNDSLATRGATWNFLRFAAGRQGAAGEAAFYRALVNSTTTGRTNLQNVLGGAAQLADYLSDWTVSLIADDFSAATTAALNTRYVFPAWNFRSIYPGLRFGGGAPLGVYPINARSLISGAPQRVTLAGGTSSYIRFGVPSGRSTLVSLASNGVALPSTMRYAIVRLR